MNTLISHNLRSQLVKIAWITLAWTLISIFQFLVGYQALIEMNCDMGERNPWVYFFGSVVTGVSAGIIGGYGVVSLWEKWLRSKSYGWTLISIVISFTIIYVIVSMVTGFYLNYSETGNTPMDIDAWIGVYNHFVSPNHWLTYTGWLFVVLGTLAFLQINDKYGPGTFLALIKGRYFHPRREQRIFMFLDLRSSTTIAESLKEEKYFEFLKDVFKHATLPILEARGEIYQYVGDEIVISWPARKGLHNANCVACYFKVQQVLNEKFDYYQQHYGVQPHFKAGLHFGFVMAGEIGLVKRDIAFSGDVLNTTSRIQEKCNELGVNILISQYLVDKLESVSNSYNPKKIGDMMLRGKQQQVSLFTV